MAGDLGAYRAGMAARRRGEALESCPLSATEDATSWEEGWWDEEAYSAQREVLVVVDAEARAYRKALDEVVLFAPRVSESQRPAFAPVLDRVREARDHGRDIRRVR